MTEPALSAADGGALVHVTGAHGSYIVTLDADAAFDVLRAELRRVLGLSPEAYQGASVRMDLGGRKLELFDVRRLVNLFREEFGANVTALYCHGKALHRFVEHEFKLRVMVKDDDVELDDELSDPAIAIATQDGEATAATAVALPDVPPTPASVALEDSVVQPPSEDSDVELLQAVEAAAAAIVATPPRAADLPVDDDLGQRLLIVDKTLRSGASIRFHGDVVVYGDVNPGAEVVAGGNILVLGSLRGLAHAGSAGDRRSVIISFDLRPTQLRIHDQFAVTSERPARTSYLPEIAWVGAKGIDIQPYAGRLPQ